MKSARFWLMLLVVLLSAVPAVHPQEPLASAVTFRKEINKPRVGLRETFTVTLTLDNIGSDSKERSCTVTDTNPAVDYLEILSDTLQPGDAQLSGQTVKWTGKVAQNISQTVSFSMRVKQIPTNIKKRIITNEATLAYGTTITNAAATVRIGGWSYLPLITNRYATFMNGDFDQGLAGWTPGCGPFDGHGNGLPVAVVGGCKTLGGMTENCALLGNPGARNRQIPVGYGYLRQDYTVPRQEPRLNVRFKVLSYDVAWSDKVEPRYFDTFEVSVNRLPQAITAQERDARGCRTPSNAPNQTYTVPGTGGLVFCSGGIGAPSLDHPWDSGWMTAELDMSAITETARLYFTLWSREYSADYWDNEAFYNTWVYIDKVWTSK